MPETRSTKTRWYSNHKTVFPLYDSNADLFLLLLFQKLHQCFSRTCILAKNSMKLSKRANSYNAILPANTNPGLFSYFDFM